MAVLGLDANVNKQFSAYTDIYRTNTAVSKARRP
jgi:hypothetical protein